MDTLAVGLDALVDFDLMYESCSQFARQYILQDLLELEDVYIVMFSRMAVNMLQWTKWKTEDVDIACMCSRV